MIIDTHAHLCDAQFDADRDEVLKRAFENSIDKIFEIACETSVWDKALEFSKTDGVYVSFGIHPHEAQKAKPEDFTKLETLLKNKKTIALGEIGLDYHYDLSPRKIQREIFFKQLDIAVKLDIPIIIHCRSAYEDLAEIFKNYQKLPKGVIHCYAGTPQEAEFFTGFGFLLGIDGPLTYPKSDNARLVAAQTDISKLLIETDCPYLAPQKYRGKRNEPSYITETLKALAAIKRVSYEEAAAITSQNAIKLFGI
ncbi:MAG: TatD family hydrolase [Endomicrobium sp.]|jgi:TatD DNase family protein|nr:TatD family hydrolase [Endomicrobium sp.]